MEIDVKEVLNYLWFIFMGIWGGTISYFEKYKATGKHSMAKLLIEWTTSAFTGITTAYACDYMGLPFTATSALAGVAGHMGGRALFIIEKMIDSRARKIK